MKKYNILFICTHNAARSIIGEAVASMQQCGRFIGYSAGSNPSAEVHPYATELAEELGYDLSKLHCKNWNEFSSPEAPKMDFIITLSDMTAGDECPIWPGNPSTANWRFMEPSIVEGPEIVKKRAFRNVMIGLRKRMDILASMPLESLNSMSLNDIDLKA